MNDPVVVDASVAMKWLVLEEFTEHAQALLDDVQCAEQVLLAPPHFHSEVLNALFQRVRRGDMTAAKADEALAYFLDVPIRAHGEEVLYAPAFAFARSHGLRSVHDSLYVVLAQMVGADLWTDDRTLLKSVGTAAPWVRWIGAYAPPRG
ncbi:MAG: type II toxin-antitoxin system VapC family toxin [Chloroflexi bacterium]|nr:type II toxin-antitoxin system VapC family toxin [Chloroflexota bacterium]